MKTRRKLLSLFLILTLVIVLIPNDVQVAFGDTISSLSISSATVSPSSASFDKDPAKQADVNSTITWNDATKVTDIKKSGTSIGAEAYAVSGSALTIKMEYLEDQVEGNLNLTVEFDVGNPTILSIEIWDTEGLVYTVADGKTTITDFNPPGDFNGILRIPDTLGGYPVTEIGYQAFRDCTSLIDITIPNSVTLIHWYAFYNCSGLTSIVIPNSVTAIYAAAFSYCNQLTRIILPEGITFIAWDTFRECTELRNITIPDSVTSIGSSAFSKCDSLTSIIIPEGVETISEYAFYECISLESVTIPDSVKIIDEWAFRYCIKLKSVIIPNGVTTIGDSAFYLCKALTDITIPRSVINIEAEAFVGCYSISIYGYQGSYVQTYANANSISFFELPDSASIKPTTASFDKAPAMQEDVNAVITWNDVSAVTGIKKDGVALSTAAYIINGNTLTIKKEYLASQPVGSFVLLIEFNRGNSVTYTIYVTDSESVVNSAVINPSLVGFDKAPLKQANINTSITWNDAAAILDIKCGGTSIGTDAYIISGNTLTIKKEYLVLQALGRLELTVDFNAGIPRTLAIDISDSDRFEYTIANNVATIIGFNMPDDFDGNLIIPDFLGGKSVTGIGDSAFAGFTALINITLPDSITEIGKYAFSNCSGLTSITIPDTVTSIRDHAFYKCSFLASISLSNNLTSIGDYAFSECYRLNQIDLPDSVSHIGSDAFGYCSGLTSIIIPDRVTAIFSLTFRCCYNLQNITLSKNTRFISGDAFFACQSLTSIEIPNSVISINGQAFYYCSALTSITIPDSVTMFGNDVFKECNILIIYGHEGSTAQSYAATNSIDFVAIPYSADISPTAVAFDKDITMQADVSTTITWSDTTTVTDIKNNGSSIGTGAYTVAGNTLTIKKEYLTNQTLGRHELTIEFDKGDPSILTIEISDALGLNYTIIDNKAVITGFTAPVGFGGILNLPDLLGGKNLTSIATAAFSNCTELNVVTIPKSVTNIGNEAFTGCTNLGSITIPRSVIAIGSDAFTGCSNLIIYGYQESAAQTYANDNSIDFVEIAISALISTTFAEFDKHSTRQTNILSTITWNDATMLVDIKKAGVSVGAAAYTLKGNTLTINKQYLAAQPTGTLVLSIVFNNGNAATLTIKIINTKGLTYVVTDGFVTITGISPDQSFDGILDIPDTIGEKSVIRIMEEAFRLRTDLISVSIPGSVLSIEDKTFNGCSNITSITIADGVTSIGEGAFVGCSGLINVTIADSIIDIGPGAFSGCSSLTNITIPDSITSINMYTFSGCSSLTNITIPGSVTNIGEYAFAFCTGLTNITIPGSVIEIGSNAFDSCTSLVSITISEGVTAINNETFANCNNLVSIIIPSSVTQLGDNVFTDCSNLEEVTILAELTSIPYGTFGGCSSLASITIPNSVTVIELRAFFGCSGLTEIILPDNIIEIGSSAFANCSGLTEITIPTSISKIGSSVFASCSNLKNVTILGNIIRISEGLFYRCTSLSNIIIPNTVIEIGNRAFEDCNSLRGIVIPYSVTKISSEAFLNCQSMTSIIIPNSNISFSEDIFSGCTNLVIFCYEGSAAQAYARKYNIPYYIITNKAIISPTSASFNTNPEKQEDVITSIAWNSANSLIDIKNNGISIGAASYTISGNTLIIKKEYLATLVSGSVNYLSIEFDKGSNAVLIIEISDIATTIKFIPIVGMEGDVTVTTSEADYKGIVNVKVDVPNDLILKQGEKNGSKEKPFVVTIPTPSERLLELIEENRVKSVNISVNLSTELLDSDCIDTKIEINFELLEASKATGKDVTVTIKDDKGRERYSWTFTGDNLAASDQKMTKVNLSLKVEAVSDNVELTKLINNSINEAPSDANGLVVSFDHEGDLPAQASVRIYVGDMEDLKGGDKIYLYYYNSATGKLETLPYSSEYKVDKDGYITIELLHCSDYVLLPERADSKIITSLRDQINITPTKKTLYMGGTIGSSISIVVNLPKTLELVDNKESKTSARAVGAVTVTYKSSNTAVVTVDSKGKITTKGVGIARITTTITLYSGKTKTVQTNITVMEPYIKLTKSKASMKVGDTYTFKAEAYGVELKDIIWSTEKKAIVVINKKTGRVTAKSKGTDYVVVKVQGEVKRIKVVVK